MAARAFIQFNKDGTFAAFDGVNHLGGTFGVIVNGQGLRFIDMTSNLLGAGGPVPAPPTETQSAFTTMASAKAITYLIEGNRLLLTCSNLRLTALHA